MMNSQQARVRVLAFMAIVLAFALLVPTVGLGAPDSSAPTSTVKLVFIHHSTGDAWLQDGYGGLAASLGTNNYFVSDTNYGWGPSVIGDHTDIGDWWTWFRGPSADTYTTALYANTGINSSYARTLAEPVGGNTVVMFKSCFPNSNVGGSPSDAIPAIGSNPLAGNGMSDLTVGNAKGVYLDLLEYFKLHPDKLFVLVVSPPLRSADTDPSHAANARALADWLVDPSGLLNGYTAGNVFVFDYYTVLTGGHHRIVGGAIEHSAGPSNYLAYPTGDSHPSAAGDAIATTEFVPMLNAAYNAWKTANSEALTPVDFPDAHLDTAVRSAIGKPTGQIYASDLATLTALSVTTTGVANLDGLEHATHLQDLDLSGNSITTITPLAGLTSLRSLLLFDNSISDISPLSGLTGLQTLYVGQNSVSSLSALSGLTSLETLDLGYMPISDISPLSGLTNLRLLNLYDNTVLSDVSPISHLTKLEWLNVANGRLFDISPLAALNGTAPDRVTVYGNWLDLTPGSESAVVLSGLAAKGYNVITDPGQRSGGALAGTVRSTSGAALAGATVALADGPHAHSATDGSYTIGLAAPGVRTITFSKPYYNSTTTTVSVSSGSTPTVDAVLTPTQIPVSVLRSPSGSSLTYKRRRGVAKYTLGATLWDARGRVGGATVWLQTSKNGRSGWKNAYRLRTNSAGKVAKVFSAKKRGTTYFRWYVPTTASNRSAVTAKQKVRVK